MVGWVVISITVEVNNSSGCLKCVYIINNNGNINQSFFLRLLQLKCLILRRLFNKCLNQFCVFSVENYLNFWNRKLHENVLADSNVFGLFLKVTKRPAICVESRKFRHKCLRHVVICKLLSYLFLLHLQ